MKTVWKARIKPNSIHNDTYEIRIPAKSKSKALSVGLQDGHVCCWFTADTDDEDKDLILYCVGTGFGKVPRWTFVGTVVDGSYIWHFFS
jgi:hypothetical protein